MSELPVPRWAREEDTQPAGTMKVKPVAFVEREYGKYSAEWAKRGDKMVFHFYKNGPFSMGFRSRLYNIFVGSLGMNGREKELLQIDWIPEFNSWCVILTNLAALAPPPSDEHIEKLVEAVLR